MEHLIRTWSRLNGSWDVTVHSGRGGDYLWDQSKYFKNFKDRKAAEDYAKKIFARLSRGTNHVTLNSPESMGQESKFGWEYYRGYRWQWVRDEEGSINKMKWDSDLAGTRLGKEKKPRLRERK